jgi:sec-independent protein translocase protein TatA
MGFSFSHLLLVALLGVLLFGRGRISDLMGDVAKGIKSFKKGLSDDDTDTTPVTPPEQKKITSEHNMTDVTPNHHTNTHKNPES